ncbi:MAG: Rieske 2Fe-2S domain-containing protein [Candidatus Bathyarchaeia archaeon]
MPIIDEKELEEGKMKVVHAKNKSVLLIKKNNKIFVTDDRCSHMGRKFSGGNLMNLLLFVPVTTSILT